MQLENGWTGGKYSLYRCAFGIYLFVHFAQLIPWGAEVFSNQGVISDASNSPFIFLFPNILAFGDSPLVVTLILVTAAGASILFAIGKFDRAGAVIIWYIQACLLGRNPLIANPSLPYIGWLLLAHACLPQAAFGSLAIRVQNTTLEWKMPQQIYTVAWILLALGYTYSGFKKLGSPSWIDGSAFAYILKSPLARVSPLRLWLLGLPAGLLKLVSWCGLGSELLFAPLAVFRKLRPLIWTMLLAMHLSLIVLIRFADLSIGMILMHMFTFNPTWIAQGRPFGNPAS